MAPVDQSEFQGIVTLLDARGILGMKKAKEARMAKVTLYLFILNYNIDIFSSKVLKQKI